MKGIPSLVAATNARLNKGRTYEKDPYTIAVEQGLYDAGRPLAFLKAAFDALDTDLSSAAVNVFLSNIRSAVREAKPKYPSTQQQVVDDLTLRLTLLLISLKDSDVDAVKLYGLLSSTLTILKEGFPACKMLLGLNSIGLTSFSMVGALWCCKVTHGLFFNGDVDLDELVACAVFERGKKLTQIRSAVESIDANNPGLFLVDALSAVQIDPRMHSMGRLSADTITRNGGIKRLDNMGVDLSLVFDAILNSTPKQSMRGIVNNFVLLEAILKYLRSQTRITAQQESVGLGRMLKAALIQLADKDPKNHKRWEEMLIALAPHAPEHLDEKQFIALAKLASVPANPLWNRPLHETLKRGVFRKQLRDSISNIDHQGLVIYRLGLQSFYTGAEYYELYGLKEVLANTLNKVDVAPANQTPEFKDASDKCRIILSKSGTSQTSLCKKAIALLAPYATSDLCETAFIIMAALTLGNPPKWPEALAKSLSKAKFKSVLLYASEPEERQQIVMSLGLQSFFTRHQMLQMGGARISDDLGL